MSFQSPRHVAGLFRYPVKGLSPDELKSIQIEAGGSFPFDRAFAIEDGDSGFDPANPEHLSKKKFVCLAKYPALCDFQTKFEEDSQSFIIERHYQELVRGRLNDPIGQMAITGFLATHLKDHTTNELKMLTAPDHSFSDKAGKLVHIINLASLSSLIQETGLPLHPARFRANIHLGGFEPFEEEGWAGGQLNLGDIQVEIIEPTRRCTATNVDPITAETSDDVPALLHKLRGKPNFGVYGKIIKGGVLKQNDQAGFIQALKS